MAGSKKSPDKKSGEKTPKTKASSSKDTSSADGSSSKLKPATSINVRHILCEKHAKKEEAVARLRSGAKFDDVAREFSEDKARQGGSLGWKIRGSLDAAFEKAAYEIEPSTTSSPRYGEVKTQFGYHVIMVEGRK